jgi:hypothetical protein
MVVGIVTLIGFCVYEFRIAKEAAFFPWRLFRQVREYTVLLVLIFVAGMCYYSMSALLPQGNLYMFSKDPTEIGIISIPNGASQILGGFILPSLVHKVKHVKIQLITAAVVQTLCVALYSVGVPDNKSAWMALQFFGQACFPFITLMCYVTVGLHVRQKDLGLASGLLGTFRSGGGSIGNAVFTSVLNGVVGEQLAPRITAAALALDFPAADLELLIPAVIGAGSGIPGTFATVPGVTPAIEAATALAFTEAYAYAFKRVFWSTIPFGVCAIIAACFVREPSMYLTNHVAIRLGEELRRGKGDNAAIESVNNSGSRGDGDAVEMGAMEIKSS